MNCYMYVLKYTLEKSHHMLHLEMVYICDSRQPLSLNSITMVLKSTFAMEATRMLQHHLHCTLKRLTCLKIQMLYAGQKQRVCIWEIFPTEKVADTINLSFNVLGKNNVERKLHNFLFVSVFEEVAPDSSADRILLNGSSSSGIPLF